MTTRREQPDFFNKSECESGRSSHAIGHSQFIPLIRGRLVDCAHRNVPLLSEEEAFQKGDGRCRAWAVRKQIGPAEKGGDALSKFEDSARARIDDDLGEFSYFGNDGL